MQSVKPAPEVEVADGCEFGQRARLGAMSAGRAGTNWSGNYSYRATTVHHPETVGELQDLVRRSRNVRVLGSRHSFTAIADAAELIALDHMPTGVSADRKTETVTVPRRLRTPTWPRHGAWGLALQNLASLPHISVAGRGRNGTHGSGDRNGNLATAVRGVQLVTASGELIEAHSEEDGSTGSIVGSGRSASSPG